MRRAACDLCQLGKRRKAAGGPQMSDLSAWDGQMRRRCHREHQYYCGDQDMGWMVHHVEAHHAPH